MGHLDRPALFPSLIQLFLHYKQTIQVCIKWPLSFEEQSLTVVFFTPLVTFHFVTDTFTFKKGDFRGIDQQAWCHHEKKYTFDTNANTFANSMQCYRFRAPHLSAGWLVYRPSREAGRWSSVEEESPSLPPLLPAGRLSADYCYPTATHPPSSSWGVGARDGHAVNTLAIFFLPTTPTSLQELQGWSCCQ